LEGDFDPEEYDRRMARAFGDEYYDKEEQGGDEAAVLKDERAAELLRKAGAIDAEEEEVPLPIGVKSKKEKPIDESAAADARAEVSRLMEEYYALDYEGTAGGLKTRFKYRSVEPSTGGLSIDEILALPDRELAQVVPIKHLAPYREGKLRPNYKALQALREARQGPSKRRRQQPGRGGPAVRLEHEGGEKKPWHDKWKGAEQQSQQSQPDHGGNQQSSRAASFAPLSMAGEKRRQGGGGGGDGGPAAKRGKGDAAGTAPAPPPAADGPTLTKAQKKNMKRAQKRAAERGQA
jgi:protein KRI1